MLRKESGLVLPRKDNRAKRLPAALLNAAGLRRYIFFQNRTY
jgi:hypothetical protein